MEIRFALLLEGDAVRDDGGEITNGTGSEQHESTSSYGASTCDEMIVGTLDGTTLLT